MNQTSASGFRETFSKLVGNEGDVAEILKELFAQWGTNPWKIVYKVPPYLKKIPD